MRGDVLETVRRIGFAESGKVERFIVLSADDFADYERIAVAPLDDATYHVNNPLAVQVEPGVVALVHHVAVVSREKFVPRRLHHIQALDDVDRVLSAFLGL